MFEDMFINPMLNKMPSGFLGASFIILFVILAQIGLYIFHLVYQSKVYINGNDLAGIMFGGMSAIYSLILAFVIIAVWNNYDNLNKTIEDEGDKLNGILAHSSNLSPEVRKRIQTSLHSYCNQIISDEWHTIKNNETDHPSAIPQLRLLLLDAKPENSWQQGVLSVIDEDLSAISDLRRKRLDHNRSQVPGIVWFILKAGSVMLLVFSYFLQAPTMLLKRIYLFFFSTFIAMCLLLIYQLDHPFTGSASVSNVVYRDILTELNRYL